MELLEAIIGVAALNNATDIHLAENIYPAYRVDRVLKFEQSIRVLTSSDLHDILNYFYTQKPDLEDRYIRYKQVDFSYTYNNFRFRINVATTKGCPTFSLRVIPNGEIDINKNGLKELVDKLRKIKSGLVLITGKMNSGKSTTLNAYLQQVNKELSKKIITIEDPIEYVHKSDKSIIIQKEVGKTGDVEDFHSGLINLLREDADIAILGEIRDKSTMDVALKLAESGTLILGTLHTRSCGETIDRIINMYEPADQMAIKNTLSSVIKLVISQRLVVGKKDGLVLVPEIMMVDKTIASLIRQEGFNVSELEDAIHSSRLTGCKSYEVSLADLYLNNIIDVSVIKEILTEDRISNVKTLIVGAGGVLVE